MKNSRGLTVSVAALAAVFSVTVEAEPPGGIERCEVVHGWPQLPAGEILGQATGVGTDSKGDVWVFHRAGRTWQEPFPTEPIPRTTVWVFDANTGQLIKSWGAGLFIMPHGLTIDRHGNVWLTDVGLQQVFKFSPDGRILMTLGEARVAGTDDKHFDKPSPCRNPQAAAA